MNPGTEIEDRQLLRVLGSLLRAAREGRGWDRYRLIKELGDNSVGYNSIFAYENGDRALSVPRYMEVCAALGLDSGALLTEAAGKVGQLTAIPISVDLYAIVANDPKDFKLIHQWASNMVAGDFGRTVTLEPPVVSMLAMVAGCSHEFLAEYLYRFWPNIDGRRDS